MTPFEIELKQLLSEKYSKEFNGAKSAGWNEVWLTGDGWNDVRQLAQKFGVDDLIIPIRNVMMA